MKLNQKQILEIRLKALEEDILYWKKALMEMQEHRITLQKRISQLKNKEER